MTSQKALRILSLDRMAFAISEVDKVDEVCADADGADWNLTLP